MPWFLETLYQATEVVWRIEPGQHLPENLGNPLFVPPGPLSPIKVRLVSDIDFIPDFVKGPVPNTIFVSGRFKALLERFEPDRHHFIPLHLLNADDYARRTDLYFFKAGNITCNALIPEASDIAPEYLQGLFTRYSKTKLYPRLMWDESVVRKLHIWIDRYLTGCTLVSDELYSAMTNLEMCEGGLFRALESRMQFR